MDIMAQRILDKADELWRKAGRPKGGPDRFAAAARAAIRTAEARYDKALAESFPASDPPASGVFTSTMAEPPEAGPAQATELQERSRARRRR
jgi:hypothetical protein